MNLKKYVLIILVLVIIGMVGFMYVTNTKEQLLTDQKIATSTTSTSAEEVEISPKSVVISADKITDFDTFFPEGISEDYISIGDCKSDECLYKDSTDTVVGNGKLTGYYTQRVEAPSIEYAPNGYTCDAFVVTGGSKPMIDSLIDWVKHGNSVNRINEQGDLVININTSHSGIKSLIKESTSLNPVELSVFRIIPQPRGGGLCMSFVIINSVTVSK